MMPAHRECLLVKHAAMDAALSGVTTLYQHCTPVHVTSAVFKQGKSMYMTSLLLSPPRQASSAARSRHPSNSTSAKPDLNVDL